MYSGIAQGDSGDAAWIASVWSRYIELFPRALDLQHRAARIAATAPVGSLERARAKAAVEALGKLIGAHAATVRTVETYSDYLPRGTLGLAGLPAVVATAFAGVVAVIAWSFRQFEAQERIISAIEDGVLTPEQAEAIQAGMDPFPGGGLFQGTALGALVWVALVGGLYWLINEKIFADRENPPLIVFDENWNEADALELEPVGEWGELIDLRYTHDDDGRRYIHEFGPGGRIQALADGSVRLYSRSGKTLWREF